MGQGNGVSLTQNEKAEDDAYTSFAHVIRTVFCQRTGICLIFRVSVCNADGFCFTLLLRIFREDRLIFMKNRRMMP